MERQLIDDILQGNQAAFSELIRKYQNLVMHIIYRMVRNTSMHPDLAQDVFLKVYQNLSGFRFQSKLSTWIGRIAYNTCINHLEKKKVLLVGDFSEDQEVLDNFYIHEESPEKAAISKNTAEILDGLIQKLPEIYGTILTLYHKENLKYTEISEIMNIPEGTVKNYLFRARKILKDQLVGKYQPEEL